MNIGLNILFLFILLFLSAFFSAAEVAFLTSDKIKLKELATKKIAWAEGVLKLRLDREKTLTAILLLNNLVNIWATVYATVIAEYIGGSAVVWVTPIMTAVIVIFGEMIPKTAGQRIPITISRISLYPMMFFLFTLTPLVWLFRKITDGLLWIAHLQTDRKQASQIVTESELEAMINISHQEGLIPTEERVMIERVFEFGDTTVYEVMVPRVDVVSSPLTTTLAQLVKIIKEQGHSRIPIYKETPDNIVGILHVKDLIPYLSPSKKKELELEKIIREPFFVPETKHISEVFKEMRSKRIHLAMVVDEYGGISGLVTLENLVEQLVGDIMDEYDTDEEQIKKVKDNTYIIAGDVSISEVNELLGTEIEGEFDTVAGFMIDRLGHLGKAGEKVEMEGFTFIVDQIKKMRITKVKVVLHAKEEE